AVGDTCRLGLGDCADGALCVEGSCREVCSTGADCTESFPPCTPSRAEDLPFSVGVCSLDCPDADADGACDDADCDPYDAARHPGAEELCDPLGVDEDCDGDRNENCSPETPDAGSSDLGGADLGTGELEPSGCSSTGGGASWSLFILLAVVWGLRRGRRVLIGATLIAGLTSCGEELVAPDAATVGDGGATNPDAGVLGPAPDAAPLPPPTLDDVQQGAAAPGALVTLEGVVTATFADGLFLGASPPRAFAGLFVAAPAPTAARGDRLRATGRVEEQTFVNTSSAATGSRTLLRPEGDQSLEVVGRAEVPAPIPLTLPELVLPELAEPYEGVLVSYSGPTHTGTSAGRVRLDALLDMSTEASPIDQAWVSEGARFDEVVGVLDFDAGGFFLRPRRPADVRRTPPAADGCLPLGDHLLCLSRRSWDDARVECAARGGRLVIIESEDENALLGPRVREHTNRVFWMGAHDRTEEGSFLWTDGSTLSFSAWAQGEPNDSGGAEDCAQGNFRAALTWNDGRCGGNQTFVCEFRDSAPRCDADADCGETRRCQDGRCVP
ncbi:MAG: lectin-like protein, partial [Myxococcota bacterium]